MLNLDDSSAIFNHLWAVSRYEGELQDPTNFNYDWRHLLSWKNVDRKLATKPNYIIKKNMIESRYDTLIIEIIVNF